MPKIAYISKKFSFESRKIIDKASNYIPVLK